MLKLLRTPKPVVICVLDGWGMAPDNAANAISTARPANFNKLWSGYPHCFLKASGMSVGLPNGIVGNSEVGHINLGSGRIIFQDQLRIDNSIIDASFFKNEALLEGIKHSKENNSCIHLIGLVGYGSVHSNIDHLFALLSLLAKNNVLSSKVKLHLFTDGRDSPPTSAKLMISQINDKLEKQNLGQIASISGRYFAMDRDNRWDRTAKAYFALIGKAGKQNHDPISIVADSYLNGITDEFIEPTIISDASGKAVGLVKDDDTVIFFNYRPDRARQLTQAFVLDSLDNLKATSGDKVIAFERGPKFKNLFFVSMCQYEKGLEVSAVAFPPQEVEMPLARVLSEKGLKQLHIAETEKYAHVTYFFNGGQENAFPGEDRILVNSKRVTSYDLEPEMSTPKICEKLISRITDGLYDFIIVNLANVDMVGHTGNFVATLKAVEAVDECIGKIAKTTLAKGGAMIVCADHGNAEVMVNEKTGQVDTEHNPSPVPFIVATREFEGRNIWLSEGLLADVAPTILSIMGITKPSIMSGRNLLD